MIIKMTDNKELVVTVPTTILCGESNADLITFMIPAVYKGRDMSECSATMYYRRADGVEADEPVNRTDETYKGYTQFSTMVDTHLAAVSGGVAIWLTLSDTSNEVILKTKEVVVQVSRADGGADGNVTELPVQANWAQEDAMAPDYIRNKEKLYEALSQIAGANAVTYSAQELDEAQQKQARDNIGAAPKLMTVTLSFVVDDPDDLASETLVISHKASEIAAHVAQGGEILVNFADDLYFIPAQLVWEDNGTGHILLLFEAGTVIVITVAESIIPTLTTMSLVGPQGADGAQGEQGIQGEPGEDGYTPVKGEDYWTEEDKAEIIQEILDIMPEAEGVSY